MLIEFSRPQKRRIRVAFIYFREREREYLGEQFEGSIWIVLVDISGGIETTLFSVFTTRDAARGSLTSLSVGTSSSSNPSPRSRS